MKSAPPPPKQVVQKVAEVPLAAKADPLEKPSEQKKVVVDITGAVSKPGVYWMIEGSRLNELVALAGGLLPTADRDRVNMASLVRDGSKVTIPYKSDPSSTSHGATSQPESTSAISSEAETPQSSDTETPGPAQPRIVNINSATAGDFEGLPAIGSELAGRIIRYREGVGGFKSIDEIKQVRGIGDKLFEKIRMYLTL